MRRGQITLEYFILMAMVATITVGILAGAGQRFVNPLRKQYQSIFQRVAER